MSDLAAQIHDLLMARRQTVATAESLTAGLVAAALTETPGASATYRGGLVVYATDLKAALAGVSLELLEERGAVDSEVARQLALGARERIAADWGIGLTGVAGPDPQDGQPVGTVYVGLAGPDGLSTVTAARLDGDRGAIRAACVELALTLARDALTEAE
ncbi:MAG TPA: CinA family protein [Micromonosporaceae bacterium]|jgi:nicotinamide-nucleotide amidase